ncbi:hypothetical protein [Comamonas thiooxydans]|uniref:hypothetical protein n=1 Tax=Comamonas thiooxydans TaxID=363952 RepID=UPI00068A2285|nr:hypothetical protein [Comamonas thiooxydans]
MKESTLQTLITARTLFEQAERDCALGDRYKATAGLIVLQDAVELVFYAALMELGVDEVTAVEKLDFDQMIGSLGKSGVKVPKSGTLKAMNKLRVTAKHYGQLMEPTTVQGHMNAAKVAVDAVLLAVVGKPFREILLTELLLPGEPRLYLEAAANYLSEGRYFDCLLATRKAFFIAFEQYYCISAYINIPSNSPSRGFGLLNGGHKAPYWTRNSEWIAVNVKKPIDYIQLDHDKWRMDAIECGINTQVLANIQRLTPSVIRQNFNSDWQVQYPASYMANSANRENAALCLDLAIEVIRRSQEHAKAARMIRTDCPYDMPTAYVGQPLFECPDHLSKRLLVLDENGQYEVVQILDGFQPGSKFYYINYRIQNQPWVWGYIEQREEELLVAENSSDSTIPS